ncbi:MAG: class I adenylate-forming enzyme family protein [Candidatus Hodarchaeales archaeon]
MSWLHLPEIIHVHAQKTPDKLAFKDRFRSVTFLEFDIRTSKLASAFLNLGLKKGDQVATLLTNSIDFVEIYVACGKIGLITVPINFRSKGPDIHYICEKSEAKAFITEKKFMEIIDSVKHELDKSIPKNNFIIVDDSEREGFIYYEYFIANADINIPSIEIKDEDPWIILYTSGTTGKPKGVVRSHRSYTSFFLINAVEFSFTLNDYALIIMPLSHVNSTFYTFVFTYIGGSVYLGKEYEFKPEEFLQIVDNEKTTFTSLIPTHYVHILGLPIEITTQYDRSSLKSLLTSSAPVRKHTKLQIMEFFPNARLFEAYGSTEAGLVTTLRPEDQMKKLGSIGQECCGSDRIRILDPSTRKPVPEGEIGELYSRSPMLFTKYYKLPEKTSQSTVGEFFSAGDMAKRDNNGFYYLVDRKDNMIITGGEKVFPSEVESTISEYSGVFDVAVIGLDHEIWGESVTAVVVPKEGYTLNDTDIISFCAERLPGYKKPKNVVFISLEEMPRTASGKILHRVLRDRYRSSLEKGGI